MPLLCLQFASQIKDSVGHACDPADVVPGGPTRKDAQDILVLCQRVLALGAKVAPDVKLSAELAGRMAYVVSLSFLSLSRI
jgi:hypothetical protein